MPLASLTAHWLSGWGLRAVLTTTDASATSLTASDSSTASLVLSEGRVAVLTAREG